MLKAGIVGLPNVGKSTLFNAVTRTRKAEAANYPFCTIDPNVGIVTVPDARLYVLKDIAKTQVVIPAAIEFVDIAGLVKGASQGEGLGEVSKPFEHSKSFPFQLYPAIISNAGHPRIVQPDRRVTGSNRPLPPPKQKEQRSRFAPGTLLSAGGKLLPNKILPPI